jgi:hypothetical protein
MNAETASSTSSNSALPSSASSVGLIGLLRRQFIITVPSGYLTRKKPSNTVSPGSHGFACGGNTPFRLSRRFTIPAISSVEMGVEPSAAQARSSGAKLPASQAQLLGPKSLPHDNWRYISISLKIPVAEVQDASRAASQQCNVRQDLAGLSDRFWHHCGDQAAFVRG